MADAKLFDGGWNLTATVSDDGKRVKTASPDIIAVAQLILIRDDQRELLRETRMMRQSIDQVRNFFHRLGERKLKRLIDEAFRKADLQRSRRLRYNARRKAARAKGRK